VDVPHPDEKSVITYVSSLYDVFPQVPSVEQSLKDNVSGQGHSVRASVCICKEIEEKTTRWTDRQTDRWMDAHTDARTQKENNSSLCLLGN
jgi:hypothetical protein